MKACISQSSRGAVHGQHAVHAALRGRLLRNQFGGQIEVEVCDLKIGHGCVFLKWSKARMRARSMASFSSSRMGSNCSGERSKGTRVYCAQLTTIRVKGLGTRK